MSVGVRVSVMALITASLLWACEEAYGGTGLPWVLLWCAVAILQGLQSWRGDVWQDSAVESPALTHSGSHPGPVMRWTWGDTGWLLIALGQWISTLLVFDRGGDRRAAANLSMEWMGLLMAWGLLRVALVRGDDRRRLAVLIIGLGTGLGVYGMWQHHVQYARQSAWYQAVRSELDDLQSATDSGSLVRQAELATQLRQMEIPLDGPQRILWEQRLLNSSEPTGTFALANTLGGVLAVCLVLLVANAGRMLGGQLAWRQKLFFIFCFVVLSYCLLLTKSRTAWVGVVVGIGWLQVARRQIGAWQRWRRLLIGGVLLVAACVLVAVGVGALDREVILESPRSLQFRLFYWTGTAGVLRESPVFGTGPGNFRSAYLRYKLPESSEEIRDPHNFVLESWTSGGLISLSGVLMCFGVLVTSLTGGQPGGQTVKSDYRPESPAVAGPRGRGSRGVINLGLISGGLLQLGWYWIQGGSFDWDQVAWLMIPVVALVAAMSPMSRDVEWTVVAGQAMALTLGIHLLGAGGFQVPAVMLLLGASLASVLSGRRGVSQAAAVSAAASTASTWRKRVLSGGTLCCVGGLVLVLQYGLRPVLQSSSLQNVGREAHHQGNYRAASTAWRGAVAADPWNVNSRQHLAEVETYRLMALVNAGRETAVFSDARRAEALAQSQLAQWACDDWISQDPRNPAAWRLRSSCRAVAGVLSQVVDDYNRAVQDQITVLTLYPGSVSDWWTLVTLQTGDRSRIDSLRIPEKYRLSAAVRETLRLHAVNVSWGHVDRFLSDEQVATLKALESGA